MVKSRFSASGELLPPKPEELAAADISSAIICYTSGTTKDGKPYYMYIAVKPSMYRAFRALTDAGKGMKVRDYGELLAGDFQASAPAEVVAEMRDKYGFDDNYVDRVVANFRRDQTAFMEQKEKERLESIVAMLKMKAGKYACSQNTRYVTVSVSVLLPHSSCLRMAQSTLLLEVHPGGGAPQCV